MRLLKFGKRETPLLRLLNALRDAGFHTDSNSRLSGLHDKILVWTEISEQKEIAVGYIVPAGNPTFCFDMDKREDLHVKQVCGIVETLRQKGFMILTSPMAHIDLPPPRDIRHKDEVTAG